jgi:D-sedoheptulose 7-phosphate isomerase
MKTATAKYTLNIANALEEMSVTNLTGKELAHTAAYDLWHIWSKEARDEMCRIYFAGNGASAMMASHMALDATKQGGMQALCFNDGASLTAIGNDLAYDEVFSKPVEWYGQKDDILVLVSSSGNSPSVVKAVDAARKSSLRVVTLSGMDPDNKLRRLGDINFYIKLPDYGSVECGHQIILHYWLDTFIETYGGRR